MNEVKLAIQAPSFSDLQKADTGTKPSYEYIPPTKKIDTINKSLKDINLPIHAKEKPNAERLVPFVEQIIQKHLNQPDPRIKRDKKSDSL